MMNMKVDGLADLARDFKELPKNVRDVRNGPLRPALRAGADVIRDAARDLAPVDSGVTRDAINTVSDPRPQDVTERAVVKPTKAKNVAQLDGDQVPYWWHMLEFGTEKMGAQPFMRPAADGNFPTALRVFTERLAAGIQRVVKRLARGRRG